MAFVNEKKSTEYLVKLFRSKCDTFQIQPVRDTYVDVLN